MEVVDVDVVDVEDVVDEVSVVDESWIWPGTEVGEVVVLGCGTGLAGK